MRAVNKGGLYNYALNTAHATPPATAQQATSRWSGFGDKARLQQLLLDEQYQLCCYSELRADLEGVGYHIEHVKPKSQFPALTFDYQNLAASALNSDDLSRIKEEVFGGHAKKSQYDAARFVSCLQADCVRYFHYLSDGRIAPSLQLDPADQDRATYTIDLLGLNSSYLINRRRKWWEELDALLLEHIANDMSLHCLAGVDLLPRNQKLSQFFSLTRQFFGRIAEEVIAQNAPELL